MDRTWLINARRKAGLTGVEVSTRLGISQGYYSLVEHGERKQKMDIPFLLALAQILGMSVEQITEEETKWKNSF